MGISQLQPPLIADITGSSFILLGVLVILVFAIAYGLYTRQGSGISQHPTSDAGDPVLGDQTKKGGEENEDDRAAGVDQTEGSPMDQRGTQ